MSRNISESEYGNEQKSETVKKKTRSYFLERNVCSSVNSNDFDKFGSKLGHSIELYVHDVKREKKHGNLRETIIFPCSREPSTENNVIVCKSQGNKNFTFLDTDGCMTFKHQVTQAFVSAAAFYCVGSMHFKGSHKYVDAIN